MAQRGLVSSTAGHSAVIEDQRWRTLSRASPLLQRARVGQPVPRCRWSSSSSSSAAAASHKGDDLGGFRRGQAGAETSPSSRPGPYQSRRRCEFGAPSILAIRSPAGPVVAPGSAESGAMLWPALVVFLRRASQWQRGQYPKNESIRPGHCPANMAAPRLRWKCLCCVRGVRGLAGPAPWPALPRHRGFHQLACL